MSTPTQNPLVPVVRTEALIPSLPKSVFHDVHWVSSIPFLLAHVAALVGVFFVPLTWPMALLCISTYFIRMFAITGGYHRYFSHRTYSMNRFWQFVMAFVGCMSAQKGPLWWAAHHRHHHRFSDKPEDIHSPLQSGFWYSHVGWILTKKNDATRWDLIKDLSKYPELRWLDRYHIVPALLGWALVAAIWGLPGFFWGGLVSTVLLWHGTFTINSLSHVFGSRRYETSDTSRNNWFFAIITLGEGWHNNHHCFKASVNQGFMWWEYDISYYILRVLSWFGITSKLRMAPVQQLKEKLINK